MTQELVPEIVAGSVPLRPKWEIYARERALCASGEDAQVRAGYPSRSGMYSKLDRKRVVRERIAYLCRDDADLVREKRRRMEERLLIARDCNMMDFAIIDEKGALTGIDWRAVKASPYAITLTEFGFDAKTGAMVRFTRDDPMNAAAQLRDMWGFKSSTKTEVTGPAGGPLMNRIVIEFIDPPQS